jgi:hypothetical protein
MDSAASFVPRPPLRGPVNKADSNAAIEVQSVTNERGSPVENFMCQRGNSGVR